MAKIIEYDANYGPMVDIWDKKLPKAFPSRETIENVPKWIHNNKLRMAAQTYIDRNLTLLLSKPAACLNHQPWVGGLADHILQVITISTDIAGMFYVGEETLQEAKDRLIILGLFHDAEKVARYKINQGKTITGIINRNGQLYKVTQAFVYEDHFPRKGNNHEDIESIKIAANCGVPMEDWFLNGICHTAGGYSLFGRESQPFNLSALNATGDMFSATQFWNVGDKK